jgi:hypothetical protein
VDAPAYRRRASPIECCASAAIVVWRQGTALKVPHNAWMSTEAWLEGPIPDVAPLLQPAAHALVQARRDVEALAPGVDTDLLWRERGAATAGFHLLHLAGALDRIYTYARGDMLNDEQKTALRAEAVAHPELSAGDLLTLVNARIDAALAQLCATDADRILDDRRVGRAGLPSTVLGLLFHGAEHTTRHVGQFISTVKLLRYEG